MSMCQYLPAHGDYCSYRINIQALLDGSSEKSFLLIVEIVKTLNTVLSHNEVLSTPQHYLVGFSWFGMSLVIT